jgi:GNAT superfamily N-acetyltransferase
MTAPDTLRKVDGYWVSYFGCSAADLNGDRTCVFSHAALAGHDGALVFRHGDGCVISVPETTPEIERSKLRAARPAEAFDAKFLSRAFVVSQDKVTGPAWVGIADRSGFKPVKNDARLLADGDEAAIRELAEGCGETAWKQSKLTLDRRPSFGLFVGGKLVTASSYLNLGGLLAYIGVVTHPAHRGKGHAKAVVSATLTYALDKGLFPMWRTLQANESGIALAGAMGFEKYASTLDIQLTEHEF